MVGTSIKVLSTLSPGCGDGLSFRFRCERDDSANPSGPGPTDFTGSGGPRNGGWGDVLTGKAVEISGQNHYYREAVPFSDEAMRTVMGSTNVEAWDGSKQA